MAIAGQDDDYEEAPVDEADLYYPEDPDQLEARGGALADESYKHSSQGRDNQEAIEGGESLDREPIRHIDHETKKYLIELTSRKDWIEHKRLFDRLMEEGYTFCAQNFSIPYDGFTAVVRANAMLRRAGEAVQERIFGKHRRLESCAGVVRDILNEGKFRTIPAVGTRGRYVEINEASDEDLVDYASALAADLNKSGGNYLSGERRL